MMVTSLACYHPWWVYVHLTPSSLLNGSFTYSCLEPQFLIYLTICNGTTYFTVGVHGSRCQGSFFPAAVCYHQGHSDLKSFGGSSVKGWLMLCRSWNLRLLQWGEGKGNQEPNPTCATLTYCEIMVKQLKLSENQSVQLPLRKSLLLRVLLTTISKNRD